jgi:hypothetical protein
MITQDGIDGMTRCSEKAEEVTGFSVDVAQSMVLEELGNKGPMSGEDLVICCRRAGLVPHDDRAFGSVFAGLSKRGLIRKIGYGPRYRGHGTAGAVIWSL